MVPVRPVTSEHWTVEKAISHWMQNVQKTLLTNGQEHLIATHKIEHINFECFVSDWLPSFEIIGMDNGGWVAGVKVPVTVDVWSISCIKWWPIHLYDDWYGMVFC